MRQSQSSTTAEGLALARAVESARPAGVRICYDPVARSLVSPISYTLSKLVIDSGLYARISDGAMEFVATRERYVDDFLVTRLARGLDQVVFLGAGFDTRAFRIPGMERTRVFEVDHPATQALFAKRLKKAIDPLPANVSFTPVDFNTQTLAERLPASGYDEHARTLFVWQGVTMYLGPAAVDGTLAFIAGHSGPGSAVIFDYFCNDVLHDLDRPGYKNARRILRAVGEGLTFGLDRGQIEPFLAQRGFCDVHDATPDDMRRLYLTGPNAGRVIPEGIHIVSARVSRG